MQVRKIVCVLFLFAAVGISNVALAEDRQAKDTELAELKQQLIELQQQMQEMKGKHESEINALKKRINELSEQSGVSEEAEAEDELAALRALAQSEAGEKKEQKAPEETVYKFGGLSLQQLNPEISVSGDFIAFYRHQPETRERTDAEIRGVELNFQSYLDPFSRLKATTHISDEGVDVEEAYFTRFNVLGNATLDLGRFRQPFGVVNRWHEDALDQVQYPLALQRIFGDEGLNQTGASLEWTLPQWGQAFQGLALQVTNTENERLFNEDALGSPSMLFHYKNYRDLSRDVYLEFGLSGLFGWNDEWAVQLDATPPLETVHDSMGTRVYGADVSFLWEPAERALYRNIEWRSEIFWLDRDILAPDNSGIDNLNAWGFYSYIQSKVARDMEIGMRYDYYEPDSKNYAATAGATLMPLAYTADDAYRWQLCPYLTWWQSEWVKFRVEYDYADGRGMERPEHLVLFQALFAAGPHKHERY
ncbi:MAG: hypothetical protein JXM79_23645 [Sedimentisphaerales bacterium]|nr:hypothetical protein [Sedimentisphaerales bacterium]